MGGCIMKIRYIAASALLHLAVLFPSAPQYRQAGSPQRMAPVTHVEIIDMSASGHLGCGDFYIGVGVMTGSRGELVRVAKGSPADRAGLQLGDIFKPRTNPRGKIGEEVVIDIERGAEKLTVTVKRDRICESN